MLCDNFFVNIHIHISAIKNNKNNTINKSGHSTKNDHIKVSYIVHIGLLTYMLGTALLGRVEVNRGGGTGGT